MWVMVMGQHDSWHFWGKARPFLRGNFTPLPSTCVYKDIYIIHVSVYTYMYVYACKLGLAWSAGKSSKKGK